MSLAGIYRAEHHAPLKRTLVKLGLSVLLKKLGNGLLKLVEVFLCRRMHIQSFPVSF